MVLTVGVLGLLAGWPGPGSLLNKLIGLHLGALVLATAFSGDARVSAKYLATVVFFAAFDYNVPRVLRLGRTG